METAAEIETARASQAGDEAEKRAASRRLTITFILLLIVGMPLRSTAMRASSRARHAHQPFAVAPSPLASTAGLCNKIFVKLMTFPLYNYPVFVNLISSFIYLPTSFAYILPMILAGRISKAERQIPQSVFIVMGALDSITGIMQLFATNFIASGSLLILLQQASIPLSMLISRVTLDTRYSRAQVHPSLPLVIPPVHYLPYCPGPQPSLPRATPSLSSSYNPSLTYSQL
ncbi:hypothetical protein T492DRAFT_1116161 [Pavlovales sp. CCMP2436]|nr:hypothetical protein T492DRAFT_1116161 [Pavlovales sp. CCMP2436]